MWWSLHDSWTPVLVAVSKLAVTPVGTTFSCLDACKTMRVNHADLLRPLYDYSDDVADRDEDDGVDD